MTSSTTALRRPALSRAVVREAVTEFVATAFLLIAVVGSGIMAERLFVGNVGLALLANAIATGGALVALFRLRHAHRPLRAGGACSYYRDHADRRVRQHDRMAAFGIAQCELWLARHLPRLGGA